MGRTYNVALTLDAIYQMVSISERWAGSPDFMNTNHPQPVALGRVGGQPDLIAR